MTRIFALTLSIALLGATSISAQSRVLRDVHGIHTGAPEISGDYEAASVRGVIARRPGDLATCRDEAIRRAPALDATLSIRFTLGPDGEVIGGRIESNEADETDLAACVLAQVARWRFRAPRTTGAIEIVIPFAFRAAEVARVRHARAD